LATERFCFLSSEKVIAASIIIASFVMASLTSINACTVITHSSKQPRLSAVTTGNFFQPNVAEDTDRRIRMNTANVGALTVSMDSPYLWRDWMPVVSKPGIDGGSPTATLVSVILTNKGERSETVSWSANIYDNEGTAHPISLGDRNNMMRSSVELDAGQTVRLDLLGHDGPYLPVGHLVSVELVFGTGSASTQLISSQVEIRKTM
jgi:hypothetical protein